MLFDLTFPCCLTTFSGKKRLSGKVICVFGPAYQSSPVASINISATSPTMTALLCARDKCRPEQAPKYLGGVGGFSFIFYLEVSACSPLRQRMHE
jgi:hypothetical protein